MNVMEHLHKSLRDAALYNPEVQVAPFCILWPDPDRQWERVISRLQIEIPELYVLGDYAPDNNRGPAIWLRCVLAKTFLLEKGAFDPAGVKESKATYARADGIPIFYLPGVGRQDLRAVESCPYELKPLAELQYRGVIWSQHNAKDWTLFAYLKSNQGGLGLDVAQDQGSKEAIGMAFSHVLNEETERLKGKRLDKKYFLTLLTGGDPVRDILQWLDQGEAFQAGLDEVQWHAFVEVCRSEFQFNPAKDGLLAGGEKLARGQGPWQLAWKRFCEAPKGYPAIPQLIRRCEMPPLELFSDESTHGSWPQWNEEREQNLTKDLLGLAKYPDHEARKKIREFEKAHSARRHLVWAGLGEAGLACALEHLAVLAHVTEISLAAGGLDDIARGYETTGWQADDAVMQALSCVGSESQGEAIFAAIEAVYKPWLEASASCLQKMVADSVYPGGDCFAAFQGVYEEGECLLFVDGLRFDTAKRLGEQLEVRGLGVTERSKWVPLPSVTATGKPAAFPVRDKIKGLAGNSEFEPSVAETGQSLKGGYHLKKLMSENGWRILERMETGDGHGNAWCEVGDIDHEGHHRGWKLAMHLDTLLGEIRDRIQALLGAGWKRVRVVTDHGWLLLPGGLPKIDLPAPLADHKWGRCAVLKPGAVSDERLFPWYWNPEQDVALARGICCYKKGEEYTHGGLSLQECLTLELTVTKGKNQLPSAHVEVTDVVWKGLRCTVAVEGDFSGGRLDIRRSAGDEKTTLVMSVKPLKESGKASVVVENEDLEGEAVMIVLIDENGSPMAQLSTIIGGGEA
ncbi:BREX-1 system phosphatase PglZ type B [Desulfoluna sp.]|uniref:BREX-1 system phosphatase PglZ type B n=1 Tax=Desulfoluna sp. TaxID=2045199 RepID=UPI0026362E0A|nr:BREX-1 system phosphatase PglZ type B [Desulfoluna sp.]